VGVEIGTSMVVRAAATTAGVGAGAGAYQAAQSARDRADNEPSDLGTRTVAQAAQAAPPVPEKLTQPRGS
jgi:hypothetical protein